MASQGLIFFCYVKKRHKDINVYSPYIMTWRLVVRQIRENRVGTGFIEIYGEGTEPKTRQVDQAVSELAHEHRG